MFLNYINWKKYKLGRYLNRSLKLDKNSKTSFSSNVVLFDLRVLHLKKKTIFIISVSILQSKYKVTRNFFKIDIFVTKC